MEKSNRGITFSGRRSVVGESVLRAVSGRFGPLRLFPRGVWLSGVALLLRVVAVVVRVVEVLVRVVAALVRVVQLLVRVVAALARVGWRGGKNRIPELLLVAGGRS